MKPEDTLSERSSSKKDNHCITLYVISRVAKSQLQRAEEEFSGAGGREQRRGELWVKLFVQNTNFCNDCSTA